MSGITGRQLSQGVAEEAEESTHAQVLRVRSCVAGSAARAALHDSDLLLSVAGRPVSHFSAVEAAVAASFAQSPASPAAAPIKSATSPAKTAGIATARADSTDLGETASDGTVFQCLDGGKRAAASSSSIGAELSFKRQRVAVSGAALDLMCTASDANTLDAHAILG